MAEEKEKAVVPAPRVLAELFSTSGTIRIELLPTINHEGEGGTSGGENEGLQDLKSRIASIESSLSDVKKADSGELEKRLGTLEDAVNKSNEQVTTLKDKVSQIDTLKTEISKFDDILDHRLDALREDIKNTYLYQIFEVGRSADKIGERVSTLESQLESITARLETLEKK